MKNNNRATNAKVKNYLIVLRLLTIIGLTLVLARADIAAGSSEIGGYVVAFVLALLLTAVFAEKYLLRLATKLAR